MMALFMWMSKGLSVKVLENPVTTIPEQGLKTSRTILDNKELKNKTSSRQMSLEL